MRAAYASTCARCQHDVRPGQEVAMRHGAWIHVECAPGGDDE